MAPQEKAQELVNKFYGYILYENESVYSEKMLRVFKIKAKNCALISVDELLEADWFIPTLKDKNEWTSYWQEVKQEIENL